MSQPYARSVPGPLRRSAPEVNRASSPVRPVRPDRAQACRRAGSIGPGLSGLVSRLAASLEPASTPGVMTRYLVVAVFRVEPPIGIEPMTYALRGGSNPSATVHRITPTPLIGPLVPPESMAIQGCC